MARAKARAADAAAAESPAGRRRAGAEVNLEEARAAYVRLLEDSLRRIVATLSGMVEVERVSLVGSYARGRADLFTDLDVVVVMNTAEGFLQRLGRLYGLLAVPVDLDLLCYTPQEFDRLKARPFLAGLLRDEVVLYEKSGA